jgi:hypothetical protein
MNPYLFQELRATGSGVSKNAMREGRKKSSYQYLQPPSPPFYYKFNIYYYTNHFLIEKQKTKISKNIFKYL